MAEFEFERQASGTETTTGFSDFSALLDKEFRPRSERAKDEIGSAVTTLAEFVLKDVVTVSEDATKTVEAVIAELDRRLSEQVNLILHHEDFQKLEGAWRGLHYLVSNTETDEHLKIKVLNISKEELRKTLKKFEGNAWDQSPVFKKVYTEEYSTWGGAPFGCLVGDYYFDHSPADVKLLAEMSHIAAASHCPFIAGASPNALQMDSWSELANPRDLTKIFSMPEYAPWRSLRESEDAKYIALALPRFLARLPYGTKTDPVEGFAFEEFDFQADLSLASRQAADSNRYTWANSAYAMAANITRSFKDYGWCANIRGIESGGLVEGLPVHAFPTDDGGTDIKCPTETAIDDQREGELAKNGFMPLLHRKRTDFAAFIGAQSLYKPKEYADPNATESDNLAARLPYIFATSRFAHYLKCMVRDKVGTAMEREDMQRWLNDWINQYVDTDPRNSTPKYQAEHPLADAKVVVEPIEGNPGYYSAKFYLRPHYQLEGLTVSLRLVSKLPSGKDA